MRVCVCVCVCLSLCVYVFMHVFVCMRVYGSGAHTFPAALSAYRPIYETAMQYIPDSRIKDLSVKYAELEMTLGEIDRARAIFQYGSQHCDPGKVSDC